MDLSRGEEGSPNRVSSPCLSSLRSFFFFLSFLRIVRATLLLSYQNTDFNFEFDERERHVAAKNRINFDEILGSARVQQTYLLLLYLFFPPFIQNTYPCVFLFLDLTRSPRFVLFNTCRSIQIDNCKKESRKFRYKRGERVKPRTPRTTYKYIHISFSFFIAIFLYDYTINVITRVKTHSQCCSSSNHFFFFFFFYNDTRKKRSHCQGCSLFRRIFYRILAIS